MRDSGELKEEVEKLKTEVEGLKLKSKNQFLNQQPIKAKSNLPKLVTKMDRLIEGVSRFIEGIEPKTKEYYSYAQWYDDMLERMKIFILLQKRSKFTVWTIRLSYLCEWPHAITLS